MFRILIIIKDPQARHRLADLLRFIFIFAEIQDTGEIKRLEDVFENNKIDLIFLEDSFLLNTKKKYQLNDKSVIILSDDLLKLNRIFGTSNKGIIGHISIPERDCRLFKSINQSIRSKLLQNTFPGKIIFSTVMGMFPVASDSILAVCKTERNLTVYTCNQTIKDVKGSISEILSYCNGDLLYINRQCVVRPDAILRLIPATREVSIVAHNEVTTFTGSREKWKSLVAYFNRHGVLI